MTEREPDASVAFPNAEKSVATVTESAANCMAKSEEPFWLDKHAAYDSTIVRLRLLWEQRRFLLISILFGVMVSTLVAFLLPTQYESTTRLMPPDSEPSATEAAFRAQAANSLGQLAGAVLQTKSSGALFVGILHSRIVQDDLIKKFDLRRVYSVQLREDARKKLASNTSVTDDRDSGIITIKVTDHNPERAAAMAQEYVSELGLVETQLNTSAAHRERVFLEARLSQVKQNLEAAEEDFSHFASKNTAIDITEQGKAMVNAVATVQGQLIVAQSQLEGLRQIYAENNYRVRELEARIGELQLQLQKLGGKGEESSGGEAKDDSVYPSIGELSLLGVSYEDLYRRRKILDVVFEELTKEYELAKIQEAKEIPNVKMLDPPNVAEKKSFPPRTLIVLLGITLALLVGVALVWGRAAWGDVDSRDPRKILVMDVLRAMRSSLRISRVRQSSPPEIPS